MSKIICDNCGYMDDPGNDHCLECLEKIPEIKPYNQDHIPYSLKSRCSFPFCPLVAKFAGVGYLYCEYHVPCTKSLQPTVESSTSTKNTR